MLVITNDEGVLVGNGPAVSDEVTVQFPDVEVEPEVPIWESASSLLQALIIGMTRDPNPNNPNPLKNSFLSIANTILMLQV
jgi:hypothetical protein